ncbi:MAG: T9SS type A sorting domain-containing protein [Bacteroidetes bacterium]|nr:T9SS type A sorting domain-containing protein [Bacteroidota bacterium]
MKKKYLLTALFFAFFINLKSQTPVRDSLNLNNINASINSDGFLFTNTSNMTPRFEVPKGSGKNTFFAANLWIGAKDLNDSLHLAAMRYGQVGKDFWPGPVSNVYDSAYDAQWNKIWKISKSEIDYHLSNCWTPGYIPSQNLIDWPGNGNPSLGQAKLMAPFFDFNNDSIYDPFAGDYPIIKGDQALFFIFNDDRNLHTESGGLKLGIELHGMAYEFDCPQDSAFWNTLFINYKIFNRSTNLYESVIVGVFTDFDIGYPSDDYVACDVKRSSFYGYNGRQKDGNGEPEAYDYFAPAQSVTFLGGPNMDSDGIDNAVGGCDVSINGSNFGNGDIDDERFGLRKFVYFNNGGDFATSDPEIASHYFGFLNGTWKDGAQMQWGGNGHPSSGSCGPDCNFMFPGQIDSCFWNTGGLAPNCDTVWTEVTANNPPGDRRGLGSSGPFSLQPGASNEFDLAFVFARNYSDSSNLASVVVMQERIDSISKAFTNDITPCGGSFSAVNEINQIPLQVNVFPNPSTGIFTIQQNNSNSQKYSLSVWNIQGQLMLSEKVEFEKTIQLDINKFANGIYFLSLQNEKEQIVKKLVIQH